METRLSETYSGKAEVKEVESVLRSCVHCGFCNATCPTYQLLGDERDGPRGRIYLIKSVLEGNAVTRTTQQHLDRCLTCRNCETTCPSGVKYSHLLDVAREVVEDKVKRPITERVVRWSLREGLTSPLLGPAMALGRLMRPLLPGSIRSKVAKRGAPARPSPKRELPRKMLLLTGCVQPTVMPNVNAATARVLDAADIQVVVSAGAGCCGALRTHLADVQGGLDDMRRNIDAWWPLIEQNEIEAIVVNASGCAVQVKEYGRALHDDADYAAKARSVSKLARDLSELLPEIAPKLHGQLTIGSAGAPASLAYHPPCTLQHGQKLRGTVESQLRALGFEVSLARTESHLCCGSAGTYSVLQPSIANDLRDRKLKHLSALDAPLIASGNVGCIQHLQSGTDTPVRHWIEILDDALFGAQADAGVSSS